MIIITAIIPLRNSYYPALHFDKENITTYHNLVTD